MSSRQIFWFYILLGLVLTLTLLTRKAQGAGCGGYPQCVITANTPGFTLEAPPNFQPSFPGNEKCCSVLYPGLICDFHSVVCWYLGTPSPLIGGVSVPLTTATTTATSTLTSRPTTTGTPPATATSTATTTATTTATSTLLPTPPTPTPTPAPNNWEAIPNVESVPNIEAVHP